jgi:endonuclease-3
MKIKASTSGSAARSSKKMKPADASVNTAPKEAEPTEQSSAAPLSPAPSSVNIEIRVRRIMRALDALYPDPPIPLNSLNTFTFLVAVVLSAQTTDGKVNAVTRELFKLASTPEEMAILDPKRVEDIIRSVGLAPRKSQNIVDLSKKILEDFSGNVPNTYEGLESLPGVGHKTASVIMSQSYDEPAIAVDTHVQRLAQRWKLSSHENVDKIQQDLMNAFPKQHWNKVGYTMCICISYL